MKKKLKDLTSREAQMICKKREHTCHDCPLFFVCYCLKSAFLNDMEKEIEVEE